MRKETIAAGGDEICSLPQAQQRIGEHLQRMPAEDVDLDAALGRAAFADITAKKPVPAFAESTRDGYVLSTCNPGDGAREFRIVDEIAAGRVQPVEQLAPGTACRIMTGGVVPEGSERVVPYEQCVELAGRVTVPEHLLQTRASYIRQAGSEIARGERLVGEGVRLQGEHLELLSSCGMHAVTVAARPAVGYFCTGSELKIIAAGLENGQKVSSNSFLMAGILPSYGAAMRDLGIAGDTFEEITAVLAKAGEWHGDVMVSTGGMGPGKYDLVEKAFLAAGGVVFFTGLAMRPGRSILFGKLGRTLFFGLPGPPYAVRTLLHALVGPALLAMQGAKQAGPKKTEAYLLHPLEVKHHEVLQLKDGVLVLSGGRCSVRLAGRLETSNCHILLHPGCSRYGEGEPVEGHLIGEPLISL